MCDSMKATVDLSCKEFVFFRAVNQIYLLNGFLVAMLAVSGCFEMLASVFFLKFELSGVSDWIRPVSTSFLCQMLSLPYL